ncbi:hypothetical protein ACHAWF_000665, partial [Thalassiosira exigua]
RPPALASSRRRRPPRRTTSRVLLGSALLAALLAASASAEAARGPLPRTAAAGGAPPRTASSSSSSSSLVRTRLARRFQPSSPFGLVASRGRRGDAPRWALERLRGGSSSSSSEEEEEEEEYDESSDSEEEEDGDEYETGSEESEQYDEYDGDAEEYESESEEESEEEGGGAVALLRSPSPNSSSLKSSLLSKSRGETSAKLSEYDDLLTPPAMQQLVVSFGVMMLANKIDMNDDKVVKAARFAYVGYLLTVQMFLLYVRLRAKVVDDRTPVVVRNPLAALVQSGVGGLAGGGGDAAGGVGGMGGNFVVKALADQVLSSRTTAVEYDLQEAKKMNSALLFPMAFMYFLHFKMRQIQPLMMQTATGVLNLVYSPLFQVYVLGRKLERPFRPQASPMAEALRGQMEGTGEADGEGAEEGEDDVVVVEEIEEEE